MLGRITLTLAILAAAAGCAAPTEYESSQAEPTPAPIAQSPTPTPSSGADVSSARETPETPPAVAAAPRRTTDKPTWWLDEPKLTAAGHAATVEAEGETILAARAAAVELAMQTASNSAAHIDKTLIVNPAPGRYKAFVYVVWPGAAAAGADDAP